MEKCVLYLRSSKDRSEVSLDAQRRQLCELAQTKNYLIVKEFEDAVESGKDDDRPGFQAMIAEMRLGKKEWSIVLALDTSRISRRRMISIIFEEQECKKQGVRVIYKSLPDADPATEMILKSILQAMDEWHSLTSKAKGLAGMNENVKQGFRAGGRAPRGYQLEHTPTGAIRDGSPVMKSKLIKSDDAAAMATYLKKRAKGSSRARSIEVAGLISPVTTLIDIERNALVYAGHTVWNRHAEAGSGTKFRDESEWVITKGTHDALITEEEADLILKQLDSRKYAPDRVAKRPYILSGLLQNTDGIMFVSDGDGAYRAGKGKRMNAEAVEKAVLRKVFADLQGDDYAAAILEHYKKQLAGVKDSDAEIKYIAKKVSEIDSNNLRLSDLLTKTSAPDALLRAIETNEIERIALTERLNALKGEAELSRDYKKLTLKDIKVMLNNIVDSFEDKAAEDIKAMLKTIVETIILDTASLTISITYKLKSGVELASPRGFEPRSPP
ncbi:recombinase family protein [Methylotenera sp.]|uniref:recombinase family protein n=1 Tax=Methylotenera sp. TaxID=2051956 RepID=UPI00345B5365